MTQLLKNAKIYDGTGSEPDISGILQDRYDPKTLIPKLTVSEAVGLYDSGVIAGGMIPKVDSCIKAIQMGVEKCIIMDGCVPHSILMELLTDEGAGTRFSAPSRTLDDRQSGWE